MTKKMYNDEASLHIACVKWFSIQYPNFASLLHHSPNGGFRNKREALKFKEMGTRAGFPDIILLLPLEDIPFIMIEFKTLTGVLSKKQKEYREEIERLTRGKYLIIRTLDEFIEKINYFIKLLKNEK